MTRRLAFLILLALAFATFIGLGIWQVERLRWKVDLIARVDARISSEPVIAPARATQDDEYRNVFVSGTFLHDKTAFVQAVTERGPGFWVMTPLRQLDGVSVLVNRGFVPPDLRKSGNFTKPAGFVTVTGLLRLTEPDGAFLRSNDPASDRWYSRDVSTIAAKNRLPDIRNFFIDAGQEKDPNAYPVGGLTAVNFPNHHLQYALTWFAMAALTLAGARILLRRKGVPRA